MNTPRRGHAPVTMRRCDSAADLERSGDFIWRFDADGRRSIYILIPISKDAELWVGSSWTIGYRNASGAQWSWDGNEAAPTLSPSLHAVGIWHGWVRAGRLVEA